MSELRYLTAGESHGRTLTAILEGMPAGVTVTEEDINKELARRQKAHYWRRSSRETGQSAYSPLASVGAKPSVHRRAMTVDDIAGWKKWRSFCPSILKTATSPNASSNRALVVRISSAWLMPDRKDAKMYWCTALPPLQTAARVAVGAVCRKLLEAFGIAIHSYVREIGSVRATDIPTDFKELVERSEKSEVRCPDPKAEKAMIELIDKSKAAGDTCGGVYSVIIKGCPVGLGSHVHWDRKLEARLCWAMMSIQAMKGVEMGMGFDMARKPGSQVHDELFLR